MIDGYADPYTIEKFKIDCWLPIITDEKDWAKFWTIIASNFNLY